MKTNVYLWGTEFDRYIFEICIKKNIKIMHICTRKDLVFDKDGLYVVHGADEANYLISNGIDGRQIVEFWNKKILSTKFLDVQKQLFHVFNPFKWVFFFFGVLLEKRMMSKEKCIFARIVAHRDFKAFVNIMQQKKVVFAGSSNICKIYHKAFGKYSYGIIEESDRFNELLLEDTSNMIICLFGRKNLRKLEGWLIELGIKENQIYWNGLIPSKKTYSGIEKQVLIDPIIGYTRKDEKYQGFKVFGDEEKALFRIVTLGGSTSDPTFENLKSWPEYLFESLEKISPGRVVMYVGGEGAYTAAQECLKMLKEVVLLKPDVVISYSGINDTGRIHYDCSKHPFIRTYMLDMYSSLIKKKKIKNRFCGGHIIQDIALGIEDECTFSENWIKCQRIMKAISDEFGIEFVSFLQPFSKEKKKYYSLGKQLILESFYDETIRNIVDYKWIHDFTAIFNDTPEVFYDICHVYEVGNRVIAQRILPNIMYALGEDQ